MIENVSPFNFPEQLKLLTDTLQRSAEQQEEDFDFLLLDKLTLRDANSEQTEDTSTPLKPDVSSSSSRVNEWTRLQKVWSPKDTEILRALISLLTDPNAICLRLQVIRDLIISNSRFFSQVWDHELKVADLKSRQLCAREESHLTSWHNLDNLYRTIA